MCYTAYMPTDLTKTIRLSPATHRSLRRYAAELGVSLDSAVATALSRAAAVTDTPPVVTSVADAEALMRAAAKRGHR